MAARENFSRKREAIYNAVCGTKVHPTAEWVYETLKPDYPDLSLGTVYRNIKKFCENGKIRSVGVIRGQEHFDGDTSKHSHFVCSGCGRVLDIFEPVVEEETLTDIEKKHDFLIISEDILFSGICPECKDTEAAM
ncbi:MAG: transcriptional repressor [Clostridia bacterium]|nr:transcriptional repressor [Clostridia bacterium]